MPRFNKLSTGVGLLLALLTLPMETTSASFAYVTIDQGISGGFTVSVIDTTTNSVVATVTVGPAPIGVAITPDGTKVFVANHTSSNVSVIETTGHTVIATVTVGAGPNGVAITPDGTAAYVTNEATGNVTVINTSSYAIVATVAVGTHPQSVAILPNGTQAYVANNTSDNVTVINTSTYAIVATVTVGNNPTSVAASLDGTKVYVANAGDNTVSVINTQTYTVFALSPVGNLFDAPYISQGIAVSPDGTEVYVANQNDNTLSTINSTTSMTSPETISAQDTPTGIAITSNGKLAYVTARSGGFVSVIDLSTGATLTTIPVGNNPIGIAITPGPATPNLGTATNFTGVQKKNDFGLSYELFNHLTWQETPSLVPIAGFFLYRDGVKITTLSASTFQYNDHNRKKGVQTVYSLTAFSPSGDEGSTVSITVQPN
jgi:YVTN family beta-propeller protein